METETVVDSQESLDELTSSQSASETQTEPEVETETETSEADTSDQPAEESNKGTRSQERIRQLVRGAKEAKEEAEYWKKLAQEPKMMDIGDVDEGGYTLDQISASVVNTLNQQKTIEEKNKAAEAMKQDIEATIEAYPDLDQDDDLSAIVMSVAEKRGISIKSAADRVMSMVREKEAITEKKVKAEQAIKSGVSAPRGESVANNAPAIDISQMSEEEKRANWSKIISNY